MAELGRLNQRAPPVQGCGFAGPGHRITAGARKLRMPPCTESEPSCCGTPSLFLYVYTYNMERAYNDMIHMYLPIYLSVCLSVCLCVCPSVRLSIDLSIYLIPILPWVVVKRHAGFILSTVRITLVPGDINITRCCSGCVVGLLVFFLPQGGGALLGMPRSLASSKVPTPRRHKSHGQWCWSLVRYWGFNTYPYSS